MSQKEKALSKFTILCWAALIAILDHMGPAGYGLDTPASLECSNANYPHLKYESLIRAF